VVFKGKVGEGVKALNVKCRAENEVGEVTDQRNTIIQYAPDTVTVAGLKSIKSGTPATYTCTSSESFPEATITWQKMVGEQEVEIMEEDLEEEIEDTGAGIRKISTYVMEEGEEDFIVSCKAEVEGVAETQSQSLGVTVMKLPTKLLITGPSSVSRGEHVEYSCQVEGGNIPVVPTMTVTDQASLPVPSTLSAPSSHMVKILPNLQTLTIHCSTGEQGGFLETTKHVTVHYPPSHLLLSGPDTISSFDPKFFCSSSSSSSPLLLVWTLDGEEVQDDQVEQSITQLEDGGVQTHSVLTLNAKELAQDTELVVECNVEGLDISSSKEVTVLMPAEAENNEGVMVKLSPSNDHEEKTTEDNIYIDENADKNKETANEVDAAQPAETLEANVNLKTSGTQGLNSKPSDHHAELAAPSSLAFSSAKHLQASFLVLAFSLMARIFH
jgi:hypothetical protein